MSVFEWMAAYPETNKFYGLSSSPKWVVAENLIDLVGQEHVVKALRNALDKGCLHHAYLAQCGARAACGQNHDCGNGQKAESVSRGK